MLSFSRQPLNCTENISYLQTSITSGRSDGNTQINRSVAQKTRNSDISPTYRAIGQSRSSTCYHSIC